MKRTAGAFMLLAGLSGCMTPEKTGPGSTFGQANYARKELDHVQGPMGTPVPVGYNGLAQMNTPVVTQANYVGNTGNGVQQAGLFRNTGPGANGGCTTCGPTTGGPVASGTAAYGGVGTDFPLFNSHRSGVIPVPGQGPAGAVAAVGALPAQYPQMPMNSRTSVRFAEPAGMKITWFGPNGLNDVPLETPARYNFLQGGIYRLKVWGIQNQPGMELYPTLEVAPATQKTATYLAHSSVPVSFTDEDFAQVASGNFLVKVVYLPDPQFQDISTVAGPSEVVSSRLEPGANPVVEAQKRGDILLIIRMGNIDLQAPNTPPMNAPNPYMSGPMGPPPAMPTAPKGPMSNMPPINLPSATVTSPSSSGTGMAPPLVMPTTPVSPTTPDAKPVTIPNPVPATPTGRPSVLPTLQ